MRTFEVTTAETVYETYTVPAENADTARAKVRDPTQRAELPSRPAGGGDDIEVIDVAVRERAV